MRDYKEFMEALSMKDMKDLGGTDAQKKIAQDRQRRREAKNKGMANPNEEPTSTAAAADAEKKKKPELRKSQIGKWSEGIKKAPKSSALAIRSKEEPQKPSSSALAKVDKTREENKAEAKQKMASGSAGEPKLKERPQKDAGRGVEKNMREKLKQKAIEDKKKRKDKERAKWDAKHRGARALSMANKTRKLAGNAAGKVIGAAKKGASKLYTSGPGTSSSGNLEGVTGKQTYE